MLFFFALSLVSALAVAAPPPENDIKQSVIKIKCASQTYSFVEPWKKTQVQLAVGTGFIISGNRILTNAHVVSDAIYLEVQKFTEAERYPAKVEYISHCTDLAILKVDDPKFYKGLKPLEFGPLPDLDSEATTYGYPMGGLQLSITRGVVSRIEMNTYAHSGIDQHLTIQTDAAINPGNSGGPVMQNGKVIGVAFQGVNGGENLGYMIPSIVVKHFLEDIADGKVDEFPDLAVQYRAYCLNRTFRKLMGLPDGMTGVVVAKLFPGMPAYKKLKVMDIILTIGGKDISNDGFIILDGRKVNFEEVMERLQVGETLNMGIWRDGKRKTVSLKAATWKMPIPSRNPYGVVPRYYIFGGLAFTVFSKGYISASGGWGALPLCLKELYVNAHAEPKYTAYKEFPVLAKVLPDEVNVNMEKFTGQVVETVNGITIHSLVELKNALEKSDGDLIEIKFMGCDVPLVISRKDAVAKNASILLKYHVSAKERL